MQPFQQLTPLQLLQLQKRAEALDRENAQLREQLAMQSVQLGDWDTIRKMPGVFKSMEEKWAFYYLWKKSAGGRQQIAISPAELAADQAVTSDAGRTRLKNFVDAGLVIEVTAADKRGIRIVKVADPTLLVKQRVVDWDGQLQLSFAAEDSGTEHLSQATSKVGADHTSDGSACEVRRMSAEDPPEVPQEEPRSTHLHLESGDLSPTLTFTSPDFTPPQAVKVPSAARQGHRGTSGGSSADDDFLADWKRKQAEAARERGDSVQVSEAPSPQLAQALERIAAGPTPRQQLEKAQDLVAFIFDRVKCPKLWGDRPIQVATAIVDGRLPQSALLSLLNSLDKRKREGSIEVAPSAFFNGAAKKMLQRHGIPVPHHGGSRS